MGLLLSILVSYVGGVELAFVIRDITHQVCLHQQRQRRSTSLSSDENDPELRKLQRGLRKSIAEASLADIQDLQTMQDGVAYDNGYRVDVDDSSDKAANLWNDRRKELTEPTPQPVIDPISIGAPTNEPKSKSTITNEKLTDSLGGIPYDNGYRLNEDSDADSVADRWVQRRKELTAADEMLNPKSLANNKNVPSNSENFIKNERTNEFKTHTLNTKPSEDSSSYEPLSQQSSMDLPEIHFDDENNETGKPYSEEYLRSLDGVNFRPIVRDDGSGRRRAFKKRQQSSSTSSCDLRSSREDELKMFTSLEQEEQETMRRNGEFAPIKYSSDPSLKVKKHSHRHKRSPAKDSEENDDADVENGGDPWGDVQQKPYHNTDLWKRERATSIVEETDNHDISKYPKNVQISELTAQKQRNYSPVGSKLTRETSFEAATNHQNEIVSNALKQRKSIDNVPMNEGNYSKRKGKNVSNDSDYDDDNDYDDDAAADALNLSADNNACAQLDLSHSSNNSLETVKIDEFISYMEHLDEVNTTDKLQFKEFQERPKRIRHTSYNTDDRDLDDIVLNVNDSRLADRLTSQEDQLKMIQAEIERINNSLNPLTRNLLLPETRSTNIETNTVCSSTFIRHEQTTEEITRIITEQQQLQSDYIKPLTKSASVLEMYHDESAEPMPLQKPELNKFVTMENILLIDAEEDIPKENKFISTERISVSEVCSPTIEVDFKIPIENTIAAQSTSYLHEESYISNEYKEYKRSESIVSAVTDEMEELEYDCPATNRIHIKEEIDSDDYHHHRRHSETAETLEYIRGREDWVKHNLASRYLPELSEFDDRVTITIRDEIDSDEYHHARRLSECLDLAYGHVGLRFVTQGSARNGRQRSPFKLLNADIDKNEFLDKYYWKGYERSTSENRDLAEDRMINDERRLWMKSSSENIPISPTPIRILVENIDDENEPPRELSNADAFQDNEEKILIDIPYKSWDLEQSYDDDISVRGESFDASPDVIEVLVWDDHEEKDARSDSPKLDGYTAEDTETDAEIIEILKMSSEEPGVENIASDGKHKLSPSIDSSRDTSEEKDDGPDGGKVRLKKSKTTRNLLDTERLTKDLSGNEAAMGVTITDRTMTFINDEQNSQVNEKRDGTTDGKWMPPVLSKTMGFISKEKEAVRLERQAQGVIGGKVVASISKKKPNSKNENIDDLVQETSIGPWFHK